MTQKKIQLIQTFLEVYRRYWKTNCGIDILALQKRSEQQLRQTITDYYHLTGWRRI